MFSRSRCRDQKITKSLTRLRKQKKCPLEKIDFGGEGRRPRVFTYVSYATVSASLFLQNPTLVSRNSTPRSRHRETTKGACNRVSILLAFDLRAYLMAL